MYYILKDKNPVFCEDIEQFANWFENAKRHIAKDVINGYEISTVFMGIDHRFIGEGEPLLFETGVFKEADYSEMLDMNCYSTWEEAEQGHKDLVKKYSSK